jgi:hypothetical protein
MALREFYRRNLRETPLGAAMRAPVRGFFFLQHLLFSRLPRIVGDAMPGLRQSVQSGVVRPAAAGLTRARSSVAAAPGRIDAAFRTHYPTAWNIWYRARYVRRYYTARIKPALPWLMRSRELSNFTYALTERNRMYLASTLAVVLKRPVGEMVGYIEELERDEDLKTRIVDRVTKLGRSIGVDPTADFGRRLGWYAIVRALKPRVVIETGVEKGLGATVLCAALLRNTAEGHPGRYFGTDIDPGAGLLWDEPYKSMGEILYGDSIESLQQLDVEIDVFINDSDHSAEYEGREYRLVLPKMSAQGIMLADNAHVTDELCRFSREAGRQFLFFREEPADHWYLGAGIGISFA